MNEGYLAYQAWCVLNEYVPVSRRDFELMMEWAESTLD